MAEQNIFFFKGDEDILHRTNKEHDSKEPTEIIRESFNKVLDGKNLSFLLGCGCSSYVKKGNEIGVATMTPLAKEFYKSLSEVKQVWLKDKLKLNYESPKFANNLEAFLGALYSKLHFFEITGQENIRQARSIKEVVEAARKFLLKKCLNEENRKSEKDADLLSLYKNFYRKLLYRNSNLQKPNVFTTNYDLYSEIAMDSLGIHYVNGFSGGIKKYFNPTIFNYALAEKMDLSQSKWGVIDNFIYLYKIHGSINWIQDDEQSKLFNVREIQEARLTELEEHETIMIYPTPLKYNATLSTPYSDLFREFQKKLMKNNNVLVTLGYSFSDEHINNLIYQAFTIPSFRLIVIGEPNDGSNIEKLLRLNDPRIWIIGGKMSNGEDLHYFKGFVEHILPDLSNDELDNKLEKTFLELLKQKDHE